ncbi:hypothetical protein GFH48_16135 [Streptomyces fagopyri]|uniref:Uncharacterized protein n=1 Tax=Streptomyces fagopyri TaxID=2662397 RepID=A0A5Q0LBW2_9ACTN|nr:hypothetical protein GFH48_16135 [Streptomyces fagopyri]
MGPSPRAARQRRPLDTADAGAGADANAGAGASAGADAGAGAGAVLAPELSDRLPPPSVPLWKTPPRDASSHRAAPDDDRRPPCGRLIRSADDQSQP